MEEIYIDGVNVAGCVQLVEEPNYPCGLGGECKGWENCYYKQLKRLEQENAELKEELQKYKDMEAKGLEEFKDVGGCWGCGIQSASDQYFNDAKKYRHSLKEISRRVQLENADDCLLDIMDIINEVLDNENNSK